MSDYFISRERPSFEQANNIIIQRCLYGYYAAKEYIKETDFVIDIGCANGYGTEHLAQYSNHVTGIDYSTDTVDVANKSYEGNHRLSFICATIPPIPFLDNSLDVVTSYHFIEHIKDRSFFIKEAKRVLRMDGLFICSTPNRKKSFVRNPYHIHEYTFTEIREEMSLHFDDFTVLGLHGNERVNKYFHENKRWVNSLLRYDILGIHKILPSLVLQLPYNFLTGIMRNDLLKRNEGITEVHSGDFYLSPDNLDEAWDIFIVARKTKRSSIRHMRFLLE